MSELDDISAPLAPQAPAPVRSSLDDFSAPAPVSSAQQKAVVSANENPDEAAKALSISKQTGIPASIVQTDLPGYDAHAKTQAAIKAVRNPAIAKYLDENLMASQLSNDDYDHMSEVSQYFENLKQEQIHAKATGGLISAIPEIASLMTTAPGREKLYDALTKLPGALAQGIVDFLATPGRVASGEIDLNTKEGLDKAIGFGVGLALGGRDIRFGRTADLGPPAAGTDSVDSFLAKVRGAQTRQEINDFLKSKAVGEASKQLEGPKDLSAGTTPVDELWQTKLNEAKANAAGEALDKAVEASQESTTKQRSPDLYEKFIEAHGDVGTVHIPAQAILDLYESKGKVPMPGDGLFGFIPGLADKATLAAETGAEIKIPLSKYIAHVDEAVHEGLKDQVRVQQDGVTREEAKAAAEEAKIEAYHASPHDFSQFDLTKIGTGEGAQVYGHGLYFAQSRAVGDSYYEQFAGGPTVGQQRFNANDPQHVAAEAIHNAGHIDDAQAALEKKLASFNDKNDPFEAERGKLKQAIAELDNIAKTGSPTFAPAGKAQMYKVHINADPTHFLDWDKPLGEQEPRVQAAVKALAEKHDLPFHPELNKDVVTGEQVYGHLKDVLATHKKGVPDENGFYRMDDGREAASNALIEAGIPGIKYLDQGSRFHEVDRIKESIARDKQSIAEQEALMKAGNSPESRTHLIESLQRKIAKEEADLKIAENPTRNFVVFDDKLIRIVEKNDNPIVQAVEAATEAAKVSLGLRPLETFLTPLFKDGEAVNITKPEFKKYSDLIDRAQEHILTKAVALAKREASKRLTPEWKANEARISDEVEDEITRSPVYLADRYFNFDKGTLPNGKKILSDHFKPMDQVKADEWAPIFGFESGSQMTAAILAREGARKDAGKGPKWQLKQEVAAETAHRMEEQYGHLQDNIALEASEAALADYNVDLLATEWKMLAKLNGGEPPLGREELGAWAKDQFDKAIASEVSYEQWRRAAEKGGRETEKALLKKDYAEAFNQKQKQMLSFLLAREAKGFEKEQARAERLFDKYASDVNLPAVDQAYTDQIHRLLQQFGVSTRRTVENTDYNLQGKPFDDFVREQNANGAMIVKADLPTPRPNYTGTNARPIDEFTVDQFRDFATMIKSLDHNGRAAKQIELAGKREAYNEVIDKIAKNLDTLEKDDFDPTARGVISGLRALGRAVDSRLLKAEKLIDWIDKKDPLGAFNSSVLRGLIEGEQGKGDMITKLAKMASELPGDRAWGKALNDATTNHELLDWETGKPMQLSNENKIAIALNYGNKSNRRILLEGYKWKEHEVEAYLTREMTDMDKAVVDGIHGLFEPLAPLVEKTTAARAGVAIPLIEGTPFNGMKGGYYPLVEDPRAKLLGQQVETDLFQKTKFDPLPTANALKQRTGKVYPLDLSISQIHSRLSQTAHAVFMQEPVVNANKVISDPIVREGIDKAFGPEYVKMLDKWIRDIADNGGSDVGFHDDAAAWLSRNLRQNVTVQLMGWKASTALIHGGSAGASSIYEIGKMDMDTSGKTGTPFVTAPARLVQEIARLGLGQFLPDAARRFFGSQSGVFDAIDFVLQHSGEMRNRQRSLQKDFGFQLDKITNSSLLDDAAKLRAIHQTYSMAMVAYLDQLTATPVWKAAYDKALVADGMEHEDAVYVADKAVREAHGSASLVSRANIGRGEINKWLTIAYNGYWNHNYNKMREATKEVGGDDESLSNGQRVAIGAAFLTAMIVAPALVHHAVRGEEAKTTGGAIAGMLVSQFGGTVPLVNTLTYSMIHNRDPSISPLDEVLKAASNVVRDQMSGKAKHTIKHEAQAFGYLTGLPPTNQAIDTFTFMNDVLHRRDDPKTVQEWARGVMTGSSKPKVHR